MLNRSFTVYNDALGTWKVTFLAELISGRRRWYADVTCFIERLNSTNSACVFAGVAHCAHEDPFILRKGMVISFDRACEHLEDETSFMIFEAFEVWIGVSGEGQ